MNKLTSLVTIAAFLAVICVGLGQLTTVHAERQNCPLPDPSVPIPFIYDPVKCQGCWYVNDVAAGAAGWDVDAPYCKYLDR